MNTVLIIDDDQEVREDIITAYWKSKLGDDVNIIWLVRWPTLFLEFLIEHPEIKYISLDHDLGHTDVGSELNKDYYFTPALFNKVLSNMNIIIHSMNPPGSMNIFHKLEHACESVTILPLSLMKIYNQGEES